MRTDKAVDANPPSLPKGGGAIRSIGDGAGAVGTQGTASFELALPISLGRGFFPALTLVYSSSVGNGPFGIGWGNPAPAVTRRTSKGVPAYTDDDLFVGPDGELWMPERSAATGALIGRSVTHYNGVRVGNFTVVRYWPRVEHSFARVEHWSDEADAAGFWLVHATDGSLHLYGKTVASRRADPDKPHRVGAWLLDESLNCRGEHIVYEYTRDDHGPEADQPRDYRAQRYLSRVLYGNVQASDQLYAWRDQGWRDVQWLFHLVFDYGQRADGVVSVPTYAQARPWSVRSDPFCGFEYGFEVATRRLCRQVLMFHQFPDLGPEPVLVQRLLLEYRQTAFGYNQLFAAHHQGYDEAGAVQSRPPLEFTYNAFEPRLDAACYQPFASMPGLNDGHEYQLVDLYGEGLPGVLCQMDNAWYYREPLRAEPVAHADAVAYGEWSELTQTPVVDSTKPLQQFLTDMTGDGVLDWVVAQPGLAGFFSVRPDRGWSNFATLAAFPQEFFEPKGQLADLMGNGLADFAMIGPRSVRLYANRREQGFFSGQEIPHEADEDALPCLSNAPTELVAFSDVLGSGQQHLIRLRHNELKCWPNLGRGRFGRGFVFSTLTFDYAEFDVSRVLLADLDGSGATDLIYLTPHGALIFMNRAGNGFCAQPLTLPWPDDVVYDRFCQVHVADLQGLGCTSLVLTVPHMKPRHWRYDFVSAKPYLLCATDNNMGAVSTIGYRSSAQEWLDEKRLRQAASRTPECRLPLAVPLVSTQTHYDEVTGNRLTRRFVYREGYYDPGEREFRGFGLLLSTDCESFADGPASEGFSAPLLSKTWYHVGRETHLSSEDYFNGDRVAVALEGHLLSLYHEADDSDEIIEPTAAELRQMSLALAGQVLRVETFAADGIVPYTVKHNRYLIRRYDRPTGDDFAAYATMFVTPVESIVYRYEQRADDPVCVHVINLRWDAFGYVTLAVTVNHARRLRAGDDPDCQRDGNAIDAEKRWWCDAHDVTQQAYYLTQTRARFIHLDDPQGWHLGLPYQQRVDAWALDKNAGVTAQTISYERFTRQGIPQNLHTGPTLVGQSIQRYRDPSALSLYQPLPDSTASFQALPDHEEVAELDPAALSAYDLLKDQQGELPFDLAQKLQAAGYHAMHWLFEPEDRVQPPLWSLKRGFSTYAPLAGFYHVLSVRPTMSHGVTDLRYDPFACLTTGVKLADGCETRVEKIDYRRLLPTRIVDPNRTVSEARYGGFGQVLVSTFHGSECGAPVGFAPLAEYQRPESEAPSDAIEAPAGALQQAAVAYFEDAFSWMGCVPEESRQDHAWFCACVSRGDVLPSGHIRASARRLSAPQAESARQRLQAVIATVAREPVYAATLQADRYPGDPQQQIRIIVTCWDGFGRALQHKQKVEPGPAYQVLENGALALDPHALPVSVYSETRWRVSERVEYNNKGLPVRLYQPYFADRHRYVDDAGFRTFGFYDQQFYDPLGRPTRTLLAKGFMRRHRYLAWYSIDEDENDTWEEMMSARATTKGVL